MAKQLSPIDKVRLIERVTPELKRDLLTSQSPPRKSLRRIWSGLEIADEDIGEVRQQMWQDCYLLDNNS